MLAANSREKVSVRAAIARSRPSVGTGTGDGRQLRGARQRLVAQPLQAALDRADLVVARARLDLARRVAGRQAVDSRGDRPQGDARS